MQNTINYRLKFLLEHFKISARNLSRALSVPDTNTQNYIGPRQAEPGATYLEKLVLHYGEIDAYWLLTGWGEPFVKLNNDGSAGQGGFVAHQAQEKIHQFSADVSCGKTSTIPLSDCEKANASLRTENELLRSQLMDKERIIRLYEAQRPASSLPS